MIKHDHPTAEQLKKMLGEAQHILGCKISLSVSLEYTHHHFTTSADPFNDGWETTHRVHVMPEDDHGYDSIESDSGDDPAALVRKCVERLVRGRMHRHVYEDERTPDERVEDMTQAYLASKMDELEPDPADDTEVVA